MAIRSREALALLIVGLVGSMGCAQVLGLGPYGPEGEDAGEDAPTAADGTVTPHSAHSSADPAGAESGPVDARASDASGVVFGGDACSGATACAPAAPAGWDGPLALWEGAGAAPPCASLYLPFFDGGTSLSASPARCSCSCGPASGSACGAATVSFDKSTCSVACGGDASLRVLPGACTSIQSQTAACGGGAKIRISGSTATGGRCTPDASIDVPAPTWGRVAIACAPSGQSSDGCASDHVCVPVAGSPFEPTFCVSKAGDNTCPAPFTMQHLYYSGVSDARGCTGCTCGAVTGVDCNATAHATLWGNSTCNGGKGPDFTPLPVTCGGVGGAHFLLLSAGASGGNCTPIGGVPTGSASPANLTTICCE
ncbi:MAG: hypothetical protein ACRENE_25925 [Polyangiaceae bacterium]